MSCRKNRSFLVWDKRALIQRNDTIVAGIDGEALFENMQERLRRRQLHGDRPDGIGGNAGMRVNSASFTAKPEIEELGNTFLFRNYQANTGKMANEWSLSYVPHHVTMAMDRLGGATIRE